MQVMKSDRVVLILQPSPIHGVGVFCRANIKKGSVLPMFAKNDLAIRQRASAIERHYAVHYTTKNRIASKPLGWHCPKDFHRMSIGWYTNHSKQPNVETRTWKALRDIKKGEEITIDYDAL
jgi:SET domain-containing protein